MVLSRSTLKSYLDRKAYTEATNYAHERLAEDAISDDNTTVISSAGNCTTILAHHLFYLTPSAEKETHNKDVSLLVDTIVQSMEYIMSQPKAVDETMAKKILTSTYQVSSYIGKLDCL